MPYFPRSSLAVAVLVIGAAFLLSGLVSDFVDVDTTGPNAAVVSALERCATCHGADGRSTDALVPHLRAQNEDYLVNQLKRFARVSPGGLEALRTRSSEVMEEHASVLSDELIEGVARFYAKLRCEPELRSLAVTPPPSGLAWCNDCHAPNKVRDISNVPSLNGQHADYLESQLLAFKALGGKVVDGSDDARWHHFMSRTVRTVSDARLRAIAEHYARQPCIN